MDPQLIKYRKTEQPAAAQQPHFFLDQIIYPTVGIFERIVSFLDWKSFRNFLSASKVIRTRAQALLDELEKRAAIVRPQVFTNQPLLQHLSSFLDIKSFYRFMRAILVFKKWELSIEKIQQMVNEYLPPPFIKGEKEKYHSDGFAFQRLQERLHKVENLLGILKGKNLNTNLYALRKADCEIDLKRLQYTKDQEIENSKRAYNLIHQKLIQLLMEKNITEDAWVIRTGAFGNCSPPKYFFIVLLPQSNAGSDVYTPEYVIKAEKSDGNGGFDLNLREIAASDKDKSKYWKYQHNSRHNETNFWIEKRSYSKKSISLYALMGGSGNFILDNENRLLIKADAFKRFFDVIFKEEHKSELETFAKGDELSNVVFQLKDIYKMQNYTTYGAITQTLNGDESADESADESIEGLAENNVAMLRIAPPQAGVFNNTLFALPPQLFTVTYAQAQGFTFEPPSGGATFSAQSSSLGGQSLGEQEPRSPTHEEIQQMEDYFNFSELGSPKP